MAQTVTLPTWTIGDRLRKAREHAGISVQEMADRLGVGRTTISNYEHDRTGKRGVPRMAVMLYASQCGVPVAWIEGGEADPLSRWITERDLVAA